ncbi:ComEC/Rec2 family competence protein [Maribacter aestuarii]|uniref:ComEC/Rec2 family competence protein n=1 Tax=Maribacter aestuarii TaxID=1130723 RepID=UPI0025A5E979|nr:ComEC/Rec2 family competence protein [Maribacter aestuarii]
MKLLAFVPIKLTLLLILGILLGYYFPFDIRIAIATTLFFFVVLGILFFTKPKSNSSFYGFIAALTTITLGIFISIQAQPLHHSSHYSNLSLERQKQWQLKITEVLKPTQFSERYVAVVNGLNSTHTTGKILLSRPVDTTQKPLTVDDEIWVFSEILPINPPLNPHQFDYKSYLKKLGIYHQLKFNHSNFIKNENPECTIYGLAAAARGYIIKKLKQANFGADELSIIQALLLGERSDISAETYNDYKNAGAVHILAVSGLHIGILLLLIQFLLRPLRNRTISLLISVILLWGFAFVAGLSPSIIRACTMFSFVAYALYLNRPSNTFNILALSMFFILLFINPNLLFQVGFQMSYAAVFAIVWIYPLLQKLWFPKNKILRYLWQLLSVSVAAQLGVLPISIFYFHQFPGLFFISNLLIVPAMGFIIGTGILVIFLALINLLPDWLVLLFNELIGWMNSIVGWVADRESFIFKSISFDYGQLVLAFFVIGMLVYMLQQVSFKRIAVFLIALFSFQSWTIFQNYVASSTNEVLVMHQTKNSILLHKSGKKLDVFTSDSKASERAIADYRIGERIDSVNYSALTNSYDVLGLPLLVIDSLGVYPKQGSGQIILLTYSPKLNLERLFGNTRPIQIIADGSNYKSYVERWQETCKKNKIPFHYTGEKGAYLFEKKF